MTLNDPERQNRGFYGFFGDSLYHLQDGATKQSLCDPNREFGIYILTWREHPNF